MESIVAEASPRSKVSITIVRVGTLILKYIDHFCYPLFSTGDLYNDLPSLRLYYSTQHWFSSALLIFGLTPLDPVYLRRFLETDTCHPWMLDVRCTPVKWNPRLVPLPLCSLVPGSRTHSFQDSHSDVVLYLYRLVLSAIYRNWRFAEAPLDEAAWSTISRREHRDAL